MANDEKKSENRSFYSSSKSYKIVISLIISAILIGSFFVLTKISSACIAIENEKKLEFQKTDMELSGEISDTEIELKANIKVPKPKTENQKVLIIGFFIYLILALAVISLLVYLAVSDDGGIRFAKLNELRNLRRQYFESLSNEFQEYEQIDTNFLQKVKTNIKIDALDKSNKSDISINLNAPISESHKKKNVKEEILKDYMNAIVEI